MIIEGYIRDGRNFVIPAKAGIQKECIYWIPACAGMTTIL
jgi:hypothetical protein